MRHRRWLPPRAGLAVLCEKPLALDLAVAQQARPAGGAGRARADGLQPPPRSRLPRCAALAAGRIGALETLHIISHDPAPALARYVATSGGLFRDMVIHDFDMARWLLEEEPVAVLAATACLVDPAIGAAGDVDTAKTILRTASGRLAVISSSRRAAAMAMTSGSRHSAPAALRVGNVAQNRVESTGARRARARRRSSISSSIAMPPPSPRRSTISPR
jgi:myo-inositol 2-dehydrogenase/D-chiro-inositol 1-dehydrogenase